MDSQVLGLYRELDDMEIRLLLLEPTLHEHDPISCRLSQVSLTDAVHFEALSYAWGDPTETKTILVQGQGFEVTNNLYHALQYLRYNSSDPSKLRILWVDAICINQKDVKERNEQVRRMDLVYRQARPVVIWLGRYREPEDETTLSDLGVDNDWGIDRVGPDSIESAGKVIKLLSNLAQILADGEELGLHVPVDEELHTWGHLLLLLNRRWFTRLWIFQEVNVARRVQMMYGEVLIDFDDVIRALDLLRRSWLFCGEFYTSNRFQLKRALLRLSHRITDIPVRKNRFQLIRMLASTSRLQCFDARDRLFALTGVMSDADRADITIDYGVGYRDLYTEWAFKRILRTRSLDCLQGCADVPAGCSWSPNIIDGFRSDLLLFTSVFLHPTSASGVSLSDPSLGPHAIRGKSDSLTLRGHVVDRVQAVLDIDLTVKTALGSSRVALLAGLHCWESGIAKCLGTFPPWPPGPGCEKFCDVLFRGPVWWSRWMSDQLGERAKTISLYETYCTWRKMLEPGFSPSGILHVESALFPRLEQIALKSLLDSQIIVSESGNLSIVVNACHVSPGDDILILDGGHTPFILRQYMPEPNTAKAYLHNIDEPVITEFIDASWIDISSNLRIDYRLMGPCYSYDWMEVEKVAARIKHDDLVVRPITIH